MSDFKRPSTEFTRGPDVKKIMIGDGLSLRSLDLEADADAESVRRVGGEIPDDLEAQATHESRLRMPQPTHTFPDRRKDVGWRDML